MGARLPPANFPSLQDTLSVATPPHPLRVSCTSRLLRLFFVETSCTFSFQSTHGNLGLLV